MPLGSNSERSASFHVQNLKLKPGAVNRIQAVAIAFEDRLIDLSARNFLTPPFGISGIFGIAVLIISWLGGLHQ